MTTPHKVLFNNRWITVHELSHLMPDGTVQPYTSILSGTGHTVAVLPFREINARGDLEFLLRLEITPPWLIDSDNPRDRTLASLTGMVDPDDDSYLGCAVRELHEEAGYRVSPSDMIDLGTTRISKASEGIIHLYAVDVSGLTPEEPPGDGQAFEVWADSVWLDDIDGADDALAYVLWAKLAMHQD